MADTEYTAESEIEKDIKWEVRKLNRRLARSIHQLKWSADNPDGGTEGRKAAFEADEAMRMIEARALRKLLKKNGLVLSLAPTETTEPESDGDS